MVNTSEQTLHGLGSKVEASITSSSPDYLAIVAGIRRNESASSEQLEAVFRGGVEFLLRRNGASASSLGRLADECFTRVRAQIAVGVLLIPAELPKLVRNTLADIIPRPSSRPVDLEQTEQGNRVLAQMGKRGVEAIRAYFVGGETPSTICARLNISEQTFEQYKEEAKFLFRKLPAPLPERKLKIG